VLFVSRRPAIVTQADIARVIRAAKQEGAAAVEVHIPTGASIIIRLTPADAPPLVPDKEIVL
jgi:hypothetical protein